MDYSIKRGINFGVVSGILMACAVIVGLVSAGSSKEVIAAAILVVAFADALSDSLSMQTTSSNEAARSLWQSVALLIATKVIIASTYLMPLLLASNSVALIVCIIWSALLLAALGYYLERAKLRKGVVVTVTKYLVLLAAVSIISYYIGTIFRGFYIG